MNKALLPQAVIEDVVNGAHQDVFAVLGMHEREPGCQQVNVFLPGAVEVVVLSASGKTSLGDLSMLHKDGLFSGLISRAKPGPYSLRVRYPLLVCVKDDPYRFPSLLSEMDCYLFCNGTQERAYHFLGANHRVCDGVEGVLFAVWAPNARRVSVVGDFNHWDGRVHVMRKHPTSGIWEIFVPGVNSGENYKFEIQAADGTLLPLKSDPYAKRMQLRPESASIVPSKTAYQWQDQAWMSARAKASHHQAAISIYEVHLGSWRRQVEEGGRFLSYRELAEQVIAYARDMGFTHLQLMPVSEYPFDGSWGYQPLGLFAPTSRFGEPDDLRYFIDHAHQAGIGILLDWVPAHFPGDAHGLACFDGTHLYEHADPRKGFHPDWSTCIFNYGRAEVVSYLISNALYWLEEFHADGLRFDAVASMLYLDYSRNHGEWIPNHHGGRENLEAVDLLRNINNRAYFNYPGIMMVAEESTAWPGVTDFTERGGLGFGFKWNLGWMNDSLSYMSRDPVHRKYHHNELTFGLLYAFSENFILPLSHDEVVHGKRSLLEKMPGDEWRQFANLRAYLAFMWTHPGKKLLFMGGEIAQRAEWNHDASLDWHLLADPRHRGIQNLVRDLNRLYRATPALYDTDTSHDGFQWVEADNHAWSVFVFLRQSAHGGSQVLAVVNMTPEVHHGFRIGVPGPGFYRESLNTNAEEYAGSGLGNFGGVVAERVRSHGHEWSINILVPPLSALIFVQE